ncbi:2-hydroxyacyl-CoA dehydratase family protein [Paenibacillus durus]|uniref:2-hydroxyglutaryl-CoA dehydratase n=1 Tax=Paenibacillus durus ATCC 35681 TaxID=1333534 RepID=A0A0F7F9N7_PAEDU|nr:2-hydroxyacyl-CoA dehydratase family protein [Paenibacillus durus]AKG35123.1 2-hydroxyglutaryl-CoA dehydratase [Paenibacillus durus ATCC 35681]
MNLFEVADSDRKSQYRNMSEVLEACRIQDLSSSTNLKASRIRSLLNAYRLTKAYEPDSKVAYVVEQFPNELVYALGMIPWNIESMAILLAQHGCADSFINLTQQNNVSRDICSFLRGSLGVIMANCYPNPDIVLANDQPCDCLSKLANITSKNYRSPFLSISTPTELNEDTLDYLAGQQRRLMKDMAAALNMEFNEADLDRTVQHSNEAREYFCQTAELLRDYRLPGVSRELLEIFGMNAFGMQENVQLCKTLYQEASDMSKKPENKRSGKRVLWAGQAPDGSHEIMQYVEKEVEVIFWAPLWNSNMMKLNPDDPYRSIAQRAIEYHWHMERFEVNLAEVCDSYGIDGIVISNAWGCRNMLALSPMMREVCGEKKIKYLTINVDFMDRNNYAFNHVKNRIDAFLEILE